jgi:hypothetical protein
MHLRGQTTNFQTRLEISEYATAGWMTLKSQWQ